MNKYIIKKISSFISFIFLLLSYGQTIIPILNFKNISNDVLMNLIDILLPIYKYSFNSNVYTAGNYIKSNKIDIVVMNHINTLDFIPHLSTIRHYDKRKIYFIAKKQITNIPIFGDYFIGDNTLLLERSFEKDKDNIKKFVEKINSGIIYIYPEGTRFNLKKLKKAQEYSEKNNLHKFNNSLYPKMKGLYTITNILHENNKMGNIISITGVVENFINKNAYIKTIITKKLGNTYTMIYTYKTPHIKKYEEFKEWFLNVWHIKNMNIENYNNFEYNEIEPKVNTSIYILSLFVLFLFFYLIKKTKGIYIIAGIIISFIFKKSLLRH
jgi:1-acyl-sn-glycerol-3-phosphate acyltransferase